MSDKHKMSWSTRLRLCWSALYKGVYDSDEFKTIHEEEQREICEKRRKEMDKCVQPRTTWRDRQTQIRRYTDCDEKL
jgi:hypothetical protein